MLECVNTQVGESEGIGYSSLLVKLHTATTFLMDNLAVSFKILNVYNPNLARTNILMELNNVT